MLRKPAIPGLRAVDTENTVVAVSVAYFLAAVVANDDAWHEERACSTGTQQGVVLEEAAWKSAEVAVFGLGARLEVVDEKRLHAFKRFFREFARERFSTTVAHRHFEDDLGTAEYFLDLVDPAVRQHFAAVDAGAEWPTLVRRVQIFRNGTGGFESGKIVVRVHGQLNVDDEF